MLFQRVYVRSAPLSGGCTDVSAVLSEVIPASTDVKHLYEAR